MNEVFNKIDHLKDEYIKIWEDVLNIESPSDFKEGVDEVGKYFIRIAEKNGWKIEIFPQKKFGDVVTVIMNPDADKTPVTLSGHMDTVHPVGLFGNPPTKIEGDKIYGPGAIDCKGGVVAGFLAMKALCDAGYKERPVMMILQSNEEVGSGLSNKATINYICERAKDSVAFLNLEGHEGYFANKACLMRKGIAGFVFKVKGISTHASYCDKEGASAIREAAYKIIELEKVKRPGSLTFNVGLIKGGSASNTVPGECEFKLDVRYKTNEEYEEAKKIVKEIAGNVYVEGTSSEVIETNRRPAMELNDRNLKLLELANKAFAECGLSTLEAEARSGGSDASDVSSAGIPVIDSLGVGGERCHSAEEYGLISSLSESAKRLAAIIVSI